MGKLTKVQILGIIFIILLVLGLLAAVNLVKTPQEIRKKAAAPAGSQKIAVIVVPDKTNLALNETTNVKVYLKNISATSQLVRVAGVDLSLNNSNLTLSNAKCNSVFFPNSNPSNDTDKIVGNSIYFTCFGKTPLGVPTPTPLPPTPTLVPIAPASQILFASFSVKAVSGSGSTTRINVVRTDVPEASSSDDMADNGTGVDIKIGAIGGMGVNDTPTPTPTTGLTITPTPTGGSSGSDEMIDVGTKQDLTINIGGGGPLPTVDPNVPQIKFKVALQADKKPEIKVRLKVVDLQLLLSHPPPADDFDSCTQTQVGEYVYSDIPMIYGGSDEEIDGINYQVYQLKSGAAFKTGTDQYAISADGWLPLVGTTGNTIYSLSLKGEKHRSMKMVEKMILNRGQPAGQEFNWVSQPLEPGDLPDPNNGSLQDCTVNSIDLSLIEERIGSTDTTNLEVGDVNYDEVINGNDISKVAHTLSTKPDDE